MPRLIPPELGNGKRPSAPSFMRSGAESAVPVLDVSDRTHELVGALHDAALDPQDDTQLLTGTVVQIDNQRPRDGSRPGPITCHVGASTLHEAATEVVTIVAQLALDMPEWVASTSNGLADVLAEHYTVDGYSTCEAISMDEAGERPGLSVGRASEIVQEIIASGKLIEEAS